MVIKSSIAERPVNVDIIPYNGQEIVIVGTSSGTIYFQGRNIKNMAKVDD